MTSYDNARTVPGVEMVAVSLPENLNRVVGDTPVTIDAPSNAKVMTFLCEVGEVRVRIGADQTPDDGSARSDGLATMLMKPGDTHVDFARQFTVLGQSPDAAFTYGFVLK